MKYISKYLLILSAALLFSCSSGHDEEYLHRAEAESGMFSRMMVMQDSSASGGAYLSMADSSQVTWDIPVEKEGYYQVVIRYRSPGGDNMQYLLRKDRETGIGFDMATEWKLFSQPFFLEPGMNKLGIRDGWGNMDLDWIALEETETRVSVSPGENTAYISYPRDLAFKVDNYHRKITAVYLDDREVTFSTSPYPYQESATLVRIPASAVSALNADSYDLEIAMGDEELDCSIRVLEEPEDAAMVIIAPHVDHGSATILRLPSGRNMLIDCGTGRMRDQVLIPILENQGIDTIHTFIVTHYHPDHDGGDRGESMKERFHVQEFIDYQTFATGHTWKQDGLAFRILNSYEDGTDENTRSLSLEIRFHDFRMVHGGDTYALNQQMMMDRFPDHFPADVFHANHHFHGSVDPEYIRKLDPDLVILQAQEAIYARAAYMVKYRQESEDYLNGHRSSPLETLPTLEVGTVVLRVQSDGNWSAETYADGGLIPGI